MVKLGINGFGRIGRLVCRIAMERDDIEVVAINNPFMDIEYLVYLFKYDSVHGKYNKEITVNGDKIVIGENEIKVYGETDPSKIPWKEHDIDVVCESSGMFTTTEAASKHLEAKAKKVISQSKCIQVVDSDLFRSPYIRFILSFPNIVK